MAHISTCHRSKTIREMGIATTREKEASAASVHVLEVDIKLYELGFQVIE